MEEENLNRDKSWIIDFLREPRRSGIFLDFDGTLSEFAPNPEGAMLHRLAGPMINRLARKYPTCVISGRRAEEVARLVGVPHTQYVGVNGMEWMEDGRSVPDPDVLPHLLALDKARRELEKVLPNLEGVSLEDKMMTLSLHYRAAPDQREKVIELAEGLADLHRLVVRQGSMVVELRPPVDIDKGTALIRLAGGWRLRRGLYAGDDLTDVEGFRGLRRLMREGLFDGVAIAVLTGETPIELEAVADVTVDGVEGLISLLERLVN